MKTLFLKTSPATSVRTHSARSEQRPEAIYILRLRQQITTQGHGYFSAWGPESRTILIPALAGLSPGAHKGGYLQSRISWASLLPSLNCTQLPRRVGARAGGQRSLVTHAPQSQQFSSKTWIEQVEATQVRAQSTKRRTSHPSLASNSQPLAYLWEPH